MPFWYIHHYCTLFNKEIHLPLQKELIASLQIKPQTSKVVMLNLQLITNKKVNRLVYKWSMAQLK